MNSKGMGPSSPTKRAAPMSDSDVSRTHDPAQWSFMIPAGGQGVRFGRGPKLMFDLHGEVLWQRAVRRARALAAGVVPAVPAEFHDQVCSSNPECVVVVGGATRQET